MSIHKKAQGALLLLLLTTIISATQQQYLQNSESLDLMVDFGYPISTMQSVRQNISQAVYFLQQNNHESVVSLLQDAITLLDYRKSIEPEDREYLEAMIKQIDALIASLEKSDRSAIADLCQQLQSRL